MSTYDDETGVAAGAAERLSALLGKTGRKRKPQASADDGGEAPRTFNATVQLGASRIVIDLEGETP